MISSKIKLISELKAYKYRIYITNNNFILKMKRTAITAFILYLTLSVPAALSLEDNFE